MTAIGGVELVAILAFLLLVLGVVGSVVPAVPGALLSLVGVYLYWWHTGYAEPSLVVLVILTLVGLLAVALDWLGGAVATRAGGGSTTSTLAAGVVGLALFFVLGPLGVIAGVAATVFVLEYLGGQTPEESLRTAAFSTVGILASAVVQLFVTLSILAAMVRVVLL